MIKKNTVKIQWSVARNFNSSFPICLEDYWFLRFFKEKFDSALIRTLNWQNGSPLADETINQAVSEVYIWNQTYVYQHDLLGIWQLLEPNDLWSYNCIYCVKIISINQCRPTQ